MTRIYLSKLCYNSLATSWFWMLKFHYAISFPDCNQTATHRGNNDFHTISCILYCYLNIPRNTNDTGKFIQRKKTNILITLDTVMNNKVRLYLPQDHCFFLPVHGPAMQKNDFANTDYIHM